MRAPLWGKRLLLLAGLVLGSLQFVQVFVSYCPDWVCNENRSSLSRDMDPWRPVEMNLEGVKEIPRRKRNGRLKVRPHMFGGISRSCGISMWDKTGVSLREDVQFNIGASDVLVYLHIQKTGGTAFGKNMVTNLVDPSSRKKACTCRPKEKRCKCLRPGNNAREWLFSRLSTGWKCGLHADWTELTNCIDNVMGQHDRSQKHRYFYMTTLRDPLHRFLSEFLHIKRGATWRNNHHWCGGRFALSSEIEPCFIGDSWDGVTIDAFLACGDNLATNRQTRMLADLQQVGCYNRSVMTRARHDELLLQSAKDNLKNFAFFGLIEELEGTQMLFERTFGLQFQRKLNASHYSRGENFTLSEEHRLIFAEKNSLDLQLYSFARDLFRERVRLANRKQPSLV